MRTLEATRFEQDSGCRVTIAEYEIRATDLNTRTPVKTQVLENHGTLGFMVLFQLIMSHFAIINLISFQSQGKLLTFALKSF